MIPSKLRDILNEVKTAIWTTNPDYDLVIDRLHLYYNIAVGYIWHQERHKSYNTISSIHLETVPVPIIDQNTQVQSYTCLQVHKPYIALNSETYISIRQQELRTCKGNGYDFYCEELFVVKHKSKYSCKSTIYFNLDAETIKL